MLLLFLPPVSPRATPAQDGSHGEIAKREESHLKSFLAQGSPKQSWEICKVHAGIVLRGLWIKKSSCSSQPATPPSAPFPRPPLRLTARMSPRMGAAPHSTVATTTGSGKAAECMATEGEGLRRSRPDRRSRSGVLHPPRPSFRILGVQPPPGPTSQLHGGAREGIQTRGVRDPTPLVQLGRRH